MTPQELFEANQKLVYWCFHKLRCPESMKEDMLQAGFLYLWKACLAFDPKLGNQFTTYAVPYVLGGMKRIYRDNMHTVKIPRSMWDANQAGQVSQLSLDQPIDEASDNSATLGDLLPGSPDDYSNLTEDLIDAFLETIEKEPDRSIFEEWIYSIVYGDKLTQKYLAAKYNRSQPQVMRVIAACKQKFKKFIE